MYLWEYQEPDVISDCLQPPLERWWLSPRLRSRWGRVRHFQGFRKFRMYYLAAEYLSYPSPSVGMNYFLYIGGCWLREDKWRHNRTTPPPSRGHCAHRPSHFDNRTSVSGLTSFSHDISGVMELALLETPSVPVQRWVQVPMVGLLIGTGLGQLASDRLVDRCHQELTDIWKGKKFNRLDL